MADDSDALPAQIQSTDWPQIVAQAYLSQQPNIGGLLGQLGANAQPPAAYRPLPGPLGTPYANQAQQAAAESAPAQLPGVASSSPGFQGNVGPFTNAPVHPLLPTGTELPTAQGDPLTEHAKSMHNQTFGDLMDRYGYGDKKSHFTALDTKLDVSKPIEPQLRAFMAKQSQPVQLFGTERFVNGIRDDFAKRFNIQGDVFSRLNAALAAPPAGPGKPGPNAAQYGAYINPQMQIQQNMVASQPPSPSIQGNTAIRDLEKDPRTQAAIQRFAEAFPNIPNLKSQIYGLAKGESGLGHDMVQPHGQYGGYFALGKDVYGPMGMTQQQFALLPFDQQLDALRTKLQKEGFQGTNLGLYNAAGSNFWQNLPDSAVVYRAGSPEARANAPTWGRYSGAGGDVTVGGIKAYYAANAAQAGVPDTQSVPAQTTQPLPPDIFNKKPLAQTPGNLFGGAPNIVPKGPAAPPPRPVPNTPPPAEAKNSVPGEPAKQEDANTKAKQDAKNLLAAALMHPTLDQPNNLLQAKLAESLRPNLLSIPSRGLDLQKALAKLRLPKGFRPNPVG